MGLPLILVAAVLAGQSLPQNTTRVVEAENAWENAEVSGDLTFLQAFLSDDYVSVSSNGRAFTKADLLAGAARYAKVHPGEVGKPMGPTSTIQLFGDTAIVRHRGHGEVGVDVLQKRDGRWTAWFSQHTAVASAQT